MDCGDTFEIIGFGSTAKLPAGAKTVDFGDLATLAIENAIDRANKSCDEKSCPAQLVSIISMTYIPARGGLEARIRARCVTGAKPLDPKGGYQATCDSVIEVTTEGSGDTLKDAEKNARDDAVAVAKKLCPSSCPPVEIPPPLIRALQQKEDGASTTQVTYATKFECRTKKEETPKAPSAPKKEGE